MDEELPDGRASFVLAGSGDGRNCVELWSPKRLPFEPTGQLRGMKLELADRISLLQCAPDQLFHGIYASLVKDACDVENILFYNVGLGPFVKCSPMGLRFERMFHDPPPPPAPLSEIPLHYHCYCPAGVKAGFQHWRRRRSLARWNLEVASTEALRSTSDVWWLLKSQPDKLKIGHGPGLGWFGLSIEIRANSRYRVNAPALMKPLFDGVISAFHSHTGQRIESVTDILSRKLNLSAEQAARHLMSADMAILGARQLLWPWRDSIQWNPTDERCVVGELSVRESGISEVAMVGEIFEVASD